MSKAIDELMTEHRLILKVLASLETFANQVQQGAAAERETIRGYAEFFRSFADKCHHGKEEDRLFQAMASHGFPREAGPIAVMLAEHVEGREHVGALAGVGSGGGGPLTPAERENVVAHARDFISLLRDHIGKEDNVLYPMALRVIPPSVMDSLHSDFAAFEKEVMGEGAHERFHRLAESLIKAYPPGPADGRA